MTAYCYGFLLQASSCWAWQQTYDDNNNDVSNNYNNSLNNDHNNVNNDVNAVLGHQLFYNDVVVVIFGDFYGFKPPAKRYPLQL